MRGPDDASRFRLGLGRPFDVSSHDGKGGRLTGLQDLEFPPLNCKVDRILGDYYQDLSPAIELVESSGLDDNGVPWLPNQSGVHSAIRTAQYALANLTAARRGAESRADRARVQLEWLVDTQASGGEWSGCWVMTWDNPKYQWLRAPWTSALASGNSISALLRGWELFGEERYRDAAGAAYEALHLPRSEMRLVDESGEDLWYEEYPATSPLRVLNGHIYALLGVLDYARVSRDPEAAARWRKAANTVLVNLDQFDLGYWSAYELRWREPATIHYQKNIHVPQLRILAALTGERVFGTVADRWDAYVRSRSSRLRRNVEIRLHRWRRR